MLVKARADIIFSSVISGQIVITLAVANNQYNYECSFNLLVCTVQMAQIITNIITIINISKVLDLTNQVESITTVGFSSRKRLYN
jgi:hypothetical protein